MCSAPHFFLFFLLRMCSQRRFSAFFKISLPKLSLMNRVLLRICSHRHFSAMWVKLFFFSPLISHMTGDMDSRTLTLYSTSLGYFSEFFFTQRHFSTVGGGNRSRDLGENIRRPVAQCEESEPWAHILESQHNIHRDFIELNY